MRKVVAGVFIAAALTTAGCSGFSREAKKRNPAPCPNILVLSDAARAVEFDGEQTLEDVAYTAEITDVTLACRYFADKPIAAEVSVDLAFGRGPRAGSREHEYKYFVAVTRRDSEVIVKEEYTIPVKFDRDRDTARVREKIDKIIIPRASEKTSGTNFEIIVGLSLTADQVIFNRSGKSLKFPGLQ
ncbi:MAG: hypothetical protein ACE5FO_10455 [Parvularculaceae bacterium]